MITATSAIWPGHLTAGCVIRVGRSRFTWKIQTVQQRRTGILLVCYGPIGAAFPGGGHCLWIGRKALRLRSRIGGWITLDPIEPERVDLVQF